MSLLQQNYFEIFGLSPSFLLNKELLLGAYNRLQAVTHPDKLAAAPQAHKRVAMQLSARINEAKVVLDDPLKRAAYLCELWGQGIEEHSNTQMPGAFLMQQMQWREAVAEAQALESAAQEQALSQVGTEVKAAVGKIEGFLTQHLSAKPLPEQLALAVQQVRQWMFLAKIEQEIAA